VPLANSFDLDVLLQSSKVHLPDMEAVDFTGQFTAARSVLPSFYPSPLLFFVIVTVFLNVAVIFSSFS